MTLNYLEQRNGWAVRVILLISLTLGAYYIKVVKIDPYFLRVKCSPKNLVLSGISLLAIFAGVNTNEVVKVKRSPVANENLIYNQP